ncbi:MAG: ACT domain-containing protein [Candidatus Micrarchaeia archaeon]
MRQFTIIVENRVGALADVCELLGRSGVNIKGISAQGQGDAGVIRLITEDEATTRKILQQGGFNVVEGDVLVVKMLDKPGELGKVARKLAKENINIECVYLLERKGNEVELVIKPDNIKKAMKVLG